MMKNAVVARMLKVTAAAGFAVIAPTILPAYAADVVEIITIEKMKFEPQQLKVKTGTTVKWVNNEKRTNHSILFAQEELPESERLFPGESWQRTFDKPGVYPYICGPHPDMSGVVEVGD